MNLNGFYTPYTKKALYLICRPEYTFSCHCWSRIRKLLDKFKQACYSKPNPMCGLHGIVCTQVDLVSKINSLNFTQVQKLHLISTKQENLYVNSMRFKNKKLWNCPLALVMRKKKQQNDNNRFNNRLNQVGPRPRSVVNLVAAPPDLTT